MKTNDSLFLRVLRNPLGATAILILLVLVLAAIFAPILAPYDPHQTDIRNTLAPPGNGHLLGTDGSGRDVFSRLVYAGRFSLAGSAVVLVVALTLGTTGGLLAGYFGGWFDTLFGWVIALFMALPGIIVLLAARSVVGPSLWTAMLIFGVLLTPSFYRLVYAAVRAVRNELYVDAARVAGLSDARIISRHVLTVIRAPIIVQAAIVGGVALAIQSGLEFLGLGDILIPTWGSILNDGFAVLYRAPTLIIWPVVTIGVTLMSLVFLSNTIRDELERASSAPGNEREEEVVKAANLTLEYGSRPKGEPLLAIKNLSVGYPQSDGTMKLVVENVDFEVFRGEVHGLVGESGSGKTQTAFAVLSLLPATGRIVSGSIKFDGRDLLTLPNREIQELRGKRMAYIPQEPMSNLDPSFTIGSQLTEPLQIKLGLSTAEAKKRALDLLARVGIPNPERTFASYPHQVSGGMAQRVLIAGAISCEPDLLIADEPTTALDVTIQAEVLDVLRDLQSEMHMAVLLVTHNFGVVADLCDRVSVMKTGRIVERGPYRDMYKTPQHSYTQELIGAILTDTEPRSRANGTGMIKEATA
jgi:peptide/nickel transport system permease protein